MMKINSHTNKLLFHMGLLIFAMPIMESHAEIFKCTNKNGDIYYNDKPCPVLDKEKKMNHIEDIKNGYVPVVPSNKQIRETQKKQLTNVAHKTELSERDKILELSNSETLGNKGNSKKDSDETNSNDNISSGDNNQSRLALDTQVLKSIPPSNDVKRSQLRLIKTY